MTVTDSLDVTIYPAGIASTASVGTPTITVEDIARAREWLGTARKTGALAMKVAGGAYLAALGDRFGEGAVDVSFELLDQLLEIGQRFLGS